MATDEVVTLTVGGENGTRTIQLPEGWIESAAVQARRIGRQIVLDPVISPLPAPSHGDVHTAGSHTAGLPGYWEWLDAARERGDFGVGEIEPLDIRFQDPDDVE